MQNMVCDLQRAKYSMVFINLDIAKAFDNVQWDYLMEVLTQMGFGTQRWSWVTTLPHTSTSTVFLNG
jgi:hypothetical protein